MPQQTVPASRIVLFGLADDLAIESRKVLSAQGHTVYSYPYFSALEALTLIEQIEADFVFCAAEPELYTHLLEAIQKKITGLPLVVSRQTDTSAWLDALQAGASDYCAPPFEPISIRWILESAFNSRRAAA